MGVVVGAVGVCAPSAWGAFPGRDGDLVVATANQIELVAPGTGDARSICGDVVLCGHPAQPTVSPNGRAIAFVDTASHHPVVIAADGSCLWCLLGSPLTKVAGSGVAFTADGRAVTVVGRGMWANGLVGVSLTGAGGGRLLVKGPVEGAVWSSRGLLALARGGWIWVGRPGHGRLRRLARGGLPSFSPDGSRVALVRGGSVWIVRVRDGAGRRLITGAAPAWSPSGRRIAYLGPGGAVEIVEAGGGRPRHVGAVHGRALGWQPLPASATRSCSRPPGSTVLASDRQAVVFSHPRLVVYGCLKAVGIRRVLFDARNCYCGPMMAVRLAGRFAALESENGKPPTVFESDSLYDLANGKSTHLATAAVQTDTRDPDHALDSLALDSSGFAAWRETVKPLPVGLTAISCPVASLCVAGDQVGNILSSTNPAGGGGAWSTTALPLSPAIGGVSCPSVSLCAAVGANHVLTATNPSGGTGAWTTTVLGGDPGLTAISCPTVSLCVAVGGGPTILKVLTSPNPTGGASSWTTASIPFDRGDLNAVSCPSASLCVAATDSGAVLTSTNPAGGAGAWTQTTIDPGGFLNGVSCPSVSLCVAVDSSGNALTSTNPAGGASTWTTANIDPGHPILAASCPSVSLCVAVDLAGNVLASTDPTAGAGAWARTPIDRVYATAVSCPSVSLCVAGDEAGNILTSSDPAAGASAWASAAVDVPGCQAQAAPCISEQLYAHDDQGTRVIDTVPPGRGNSIGNVALAADPPVLSWTHGGTHRQLRLR